MCRIDQAPRIRTSDSDFVLQVQACSRLTILSCIRTPKIAMWHFLPRQARLYDHIRGPGNLINSFHHH